MSSDRSRHFIPFGFKGFRESGDEDETDHNAKDHLRQTVLKALNETPKFSEEPPPTRYETPCILFPIRVDKRAELCAFAVSVDCLRRKRRS